MWGVAPMTMPDGHRDISPYDKSAHLLACPPAKKVFWTESRQTSPARLFYHALWLDVFIPGVFGVAVDSISVFVPGTRCAPCGLPQHVPAKCSGVFPNRRVMNLRRRP